MFITTLFAITKIWKQPKCPPTDEWIKKNVVYIYIYICIHTNMHIQWNTTSYKKDDPWWRSG